MAASLCPSNTQAGTSHNAMSIGSRKDLDEYLQERLCRVPPGMRTPSPLISIIIDEITESSVHSRVLAPKKEQTMSAIEGFAPLILSLLGIAEPSPRFV